jgi:hypothetical protein
MKKYILIPLFILLNFSINSQTILEGLDSPDWGERMNAVIEIRDNKLIVYKTALTDRVRIQPNLTLKYYFLLALYALEYENVEKYLLKFIDDINNGKLPLYEQPLYYKVKATELLVKLDNLSTVIYVFEYVNPDPVKHGERFIPLLKEIAIKMPKHSQAIKEILINIKDNSEFYTNRREALEDLILIFGEVYLQAEILSSIIKEPNPDIRNYAMAQYNFPDRK